MPVVRLPSERPVSDATPTPREQCAAHGHVWFNVVPGLDRCVRCDAEIFDLDAEPIVVDLGAPDPDRGA